MNQWQKTKVALKMIHELVPRSLRVLVLAALVTVLYPYYASTSLALIINALTTKAALNNLIMLVVGLSFGGLLFGLLNNWMNLQVTLIKQEIYLRFTQRSAEKTMTLNYEQLESPEVMALRTKGENALVYNNALNQVIDGLFSGTLNVVISFVITVVTMVAILTTHSGQNSSLAQFTNSPWFSLILLIALAVPLLLSVVLSNRNRHLQQTVMDQIVSFNQADGYFTNQVLLNDDSGAIFRAFKASNSFLQWITQQFKLTPIQLVIANRQKMALNTASLQALTLLVTGGLYALICLKAYVGAITIGAIIIYVGYLQNFINVVSANIAQWNDGLAMLDYLNTLIDFLALPDAGAPAELTELTDDAQTTTTAPTEQGEEPSANVTEAAAPTSDSAVSLAPTIQFEHVWFHYAGSQRWVIKDLNLTLTPQTQVAIVGRNGSGKTTIVKLLCRLYQPTRGRILINGQDIRELSADQFQQLIGVVFQDFKLLAYPIDQNIAAAADVDPAKMWSALAASGMGTWVKQLPEGEKTWLSHDLNDHGRDVSGGEGQKLAIARAYYKDAPILILDEPTAALDPQSEFDIYQNFQTISNGKSALYISHRMGSCRFCDRILVLQAGQIIQDGDHQSLLADTAGLYHRLYTAQAQYYQS